MIRDRDTNRLSRHAGWVWLVACLLARPLVAGGEPAGVSDLEGAAGIEITSLPPYGSHLPLEGVVTGVTPADHHVAVYLFLEGGGWWTKPTFDDPCTPIAANGSWQTDVTTGPCDPFATKLAAFLLPSSEGCPLAMGDAVPPEELATTALASTIVDRNPYLDDPLVAFGHPWVRKDGRCQPVGPGPNYFSPDHVWVDGAGDLHLLVDRVGSQWHCAELYLRDPLGYGRYRILTTGRVDLLDPWAVFGIFTWDNFAPPNHRELDIELSRWGDAGAVDNAQFVVQPFAEPGHLERFPVALADGDSDLTHLMEWSPGRVVFAVFRGHHLDAPPESDLVHRWTYAGADVPGPGLETLRLNLWLFQSTPPAQAREVVVTGFRFVDSVIFVDGFESGDTSRWSAAPP